MNNLCIVTSFHFRLRIRDVFKIKKSQKRETIDFRFFIFYDFFHYNGDLFQFVFAMTTIILNFQRFTRFENLKKFENSEYYDVNDWKKLKKNDQNKELLWNCCIFEFRYKIKKNEKLKSNDVKSVAKIEKKTKNSKMKISMKKSKKSI